METKLSKLAETLDEDSQSHHQIVIEPNEHHLAMETGQWGHQLSLDQKAFFVNMRNSAFDAHPDFPQTGKSQ